MFSIGEKIVKTNTGVCIVESIVEMEGPGSQDKKPYYKLVPASDQNAQVFVPVDSEKSNLRSIMTRSEALDFIRSIESIECTWIKSDKQREQEYKDAIRSNSPAELVGIIKNLYLRGKERQEQGKKVTAVDDRYFKMAEKALYSELAASLECTIDEVSLMISEYIENGKQI